MLYEGYLEAGDVVVPVARGCYVVSRGLSKFRGAFDLGVVSRVEDLVDLAADDSLEVSLRVPGGLALGDSAGDVRVRGGVKPHVDQSDGVHGPVELSVSAAFQPVPVGESGGAGIGETPAKDANAASERNRPEWPLVLQRCLF